MNFTGDEERGPILLAGARRELQTIAALHKSLVGPQSAKRITDKILNHLELLNTFPNLGRPLPDAELQAKEYRMLVTENYISIYRVIDDMVYVYHIVDGRTNYPNLFALLD
ncbi:MAG: type II toxin-antitoxin system RelE/ParE family toxin [Treponema sp.]|jgi:plasmid stabilization system protein ParE|nr:type II toxin-antitoxin system RelE/ParE family toxin [Treponema sp.]